MIGWSLKASLLATFGGSFLKEKVLINPVLSILDHPQLTLQVHCKRLLQELKLIKA